ncbi:MAG: class I tRNA ligase family protein [Parcubacteria group bacterium]
MSRERYWGTPLPVWECQTGKSEIQNSKSVQRSRADRLHCAAEINSKLKNLNSKSCGNQKVIGSFEELERLSGKKIDDPHRPFIDDIVLKCDKCGGEMKRTPEVLDCWFDSGSMPFAQYHYPFENKDLIDKKIQFPAEFISEAIDQTRGWFYTLLAVSTLLGKGAPYKNVISLAHIRDKAGKKMSKSRGNIVDPGEMIEKYGADSLRMLFYSMSQPGDYKNFDEKLLRETLNKVVMMLNNIASFYKMYSDFPTSNIQPPTSNILDKWILSKLNSLIDEATGDLDDYHIFEASRSIIAFIDELSTWYIRRSRDRFKDEATRGEAAVTLKEVLEKLAKLMAPFTPFIAEHVWQELGNVESVHLQDWPEAEKKMINGKLLDSMLNVRKIVELGLAKRDESKIKVRQPLGELKYKGKELDKELESIVADELNVKNVEFDGKSDVFSIELDLKMTEELKQEGLLRELVRTVNNLRKEKGLTITDKVGLTYQTDSVELKKLFANEKLAEQLKKSTLLSGVEEGSGETEVMLNEEKILLSLK